MFGFKKKKEDFKQDSKNEISLAVTRDNFFYGFLKDNPQSKSVGLIDFGLNNNLSSTNFLKEKNAGIFNAINSVLSNDFLLFPKIRLLEFVNCESLSVDLIREIQNITSDFIIADTDYNVKAIILIDSPTNEFQLKKMLIIKRFCQINSIDFFNFEDSADCFINEKFQTYSG